MMLWFSILLEVTEYLSDWGGFSFLKLFVVFVHFRVYEDSESDHDDRVYEVVAMHCREGKRF